MRVLTGHNAFPTDTESRPPDRRESFHLLAPLVAGSTLRTLENIHQETDPELFAEDLWSWAREQERFSGEAIAFPIYQVLASGENYPIPVRERAQARLAVMSGGGPMGDRLEYFFHRGWDEASSPSFFLGMVAGGLAHHLGRMAGLGAASGFGLGRWSHFGLSRLTGLAAETTGFVVTARAVRASSLPDGIQGEFWQEWRSAALMLGMLRAASAGFSKIFQVLAEGSVLSEHALTAAAFRHGGMISGILASQFLEQRVLGWQRPMESGAFWTHALATWATFNVGGHLARGVLGRNFLHWEARMESHWRSLEGPASPWWIEALANSHALPSPLLASAAAAAGGVEGSAKPQLVLMAAHPSQGGGGNNGRRTVPFTQKMVRVGERDPLVIRNPWEVSRRLLNGDYEFIERLQQGDVEFEWRSPVRFDPYQEAILVILNGPAIRNSIIVPREVRFVFPLDPQRSPVAFVKRSFGGGLFRKLNGAGVISEGNGSTPLGQISLKPPRLPREVADSNRVDRVLLKYLESMDGETYARTTRPMAHDPGQLWHQIKEMVQDPSESANRQVLRYEGPVLTEAELQNIRSFLVYLPEGRVLVIEDARGEKSYSFENRNLRVSMGEEDLAEPNH